MIDPDVFSFVIVKQEGIKCLLGLLIFGNHIKVHISQQKIYGMILSHTKNF